MLLYNAEKREAANNCIRKNYLVMEYIAEVYRQISILIVIRTQRNVIALL